MKKLKSAVALLVGLYFLVAVLFFAPYYNWPYAKEYGFLNWLFFGEFVATAKAMVWPYFTLLSESNTKEETQTVSSGAASTQPMEYTDNVYNYAFLFPSNWKMKKPLETQVGEMRVLLAGPSGTTAFVIVLPMEGRTITKAQYDKNPNRDAIVEGFMNLTVEHVYKKSANDAKATRMAVSEKKMLPSEEGIMFGISTLQFIGPKEIPMVMAGIHVIPFGKDHLINFVMITPLDSKAKQENGTYEFDKVISSFHLLGEDPIAKPDSRR